ncbi:MAG: nucleoside triphosphate pyrophosphohydrolase [Candidatus Peribacteria bacterium]|jgi:predicted house-cleaning noncanonical NTP pyrophosphatase (MazG superfamily)|nr:nucleoside triphosphate pyrophosphohydrolase [Candidatus Peribacteria bacterium]
MKHDKLVRDHIPQHITADGRKCVYHQASKREFQTKLLQKFYEDVRGFLNATQIADKREKLADLHEVCEHLMDYYGIKKEEIRTLKESKKLQF